MHYFCTVDLFLRSTAKFVSSNLEPYNSSYTFSSFKTNLEKSFSFYFEIPPNQNATRTPLLHPSFTQRNGQAGPAVNPSGGG
jgi:hypothetical protein